MEEEEEEEEEGEEEERRIVVRSHTILCSHPWGRACSCSSSSSTVVQSADATDKTEFCEQTSKQQ